MDVALANDHTADGAHCTGQTRAYWYVAHSFWKDWIFYSRRELQNCIVKYNPPLAESHSVKRRMPLASQKPRPVVCCAPACLVPGCVSKREGNCVRVSTPCMRLPSIVPQKLMVRKPNVAKSLCETNVRCKRRRCLLNYTYKACSL